MDKAEWRRRIRTQRGARQPDTGSIVAHLEAFLARSVPGGALVVIYDALADEVSLDPLIAAHPDPEARFALTRTPDAGHDLTVHPFGGPTETHRYGYRQPRPDGPVVADAEVGAVLVPGLAFDRAGIRLGRGAGYYDRFLARLDAGVLRIGVPADDLVDRLPAEDHDVAMTHLATPDGVLPVPLDGTGLSSG